MAELRVYAVVSGGEEDWDNFFVQLDNDNLYKRVNEIAVAAQNFFSHKKRSDDGRLAMISYELSDPSRVKIEDYGNPGVSVGERQKTQVITRAIVKKVLGDSNIEIVGFGTKEEAEQQAKQYLLDNSEFWYIEQDLRFP